MDKQPIQRDQKCSEIKELATHTAANVRSKLTGLAAHTATKSAWKLMNL